MCQTTDASLFLDVGLPDAEGSEVTIGSEALLNSIRHVFFYVISAQENNQPMDFLYLEAANGALSFVGLDGHVPAWDKIADLEYYKYASMFADLPLHTAASKKEFLDAVKEPGHVQTYRPSSLL